MISCIRTNAQHPDFIHLVSQLDTELRLMDGDDHAFYAAFNKPDRIRNVVVLYENGLPLGCGAIRETEPGITEVKRMFVHPASRGKGYGSRLLHELESWALELGYQKCILETTTRQPDAVALYRKNGYQVIPNFGPYINDSSSLCFEKSLV